MNKLIPQKRNKCRYERIDIDWNESENEDTEKEGCSDVIVGSEDSSCVSSLTLSTGVRSPTL